MSLAESIVILVFVLREAKRGPNCKMDDLKFQKWLPQGLSKYKFIKENLRNETCVVLKQRLRKQLDGIHGELLALKPYHFQLVFQKLAISALLRCELAMVLSETAVDRAKQLLEEALEIVKPRHMHPDLVLLTVYIVRGHFTLFIGENEMKNARKYSNDLSRMYEKIEYTTPKGLVSLNDLFLNQREREEKWSSFSEHIRANIGMLNGEYFDTIADFWWKTVQNALLIDDELFKWFNDLIEFSNILIDGKKFVIARRIISCLSVLKAYCKSQFDPRRNKKKEIWGKFEQLDKSIDHLWGKYVVSLMEHSIEVIKNPRSRSDETLPEGFNHFEYFSEAKVREIEDQVFFTPVRRKSRVKKLFLFGIRHLNDAERYYDLTEDTDDHIRITMSLSKIYRFMAALEDDDGFGCKMYKRPTELLEKETTKPWVDNFPEARKDIAYDLVECYFQWANKQQKIVRLQKDQPIIADKQNLNILCGNVIAYGEIFFSYFRQTTHWLFPDEFLERGINTFTYLAESHILLVETEDKLMNFRTAVMVYQQLLMYFFENPEDAYFTKLTVPMLKQNIMQLSVIVQNLEREKQLPTV